MEFEQLANRLLAYDSKELGVGVDTDEIRNAEELLGVRISGSYRSFLQQFGWGGVEHIELYGLGHGVPNCQHLTKITISERTDMMPRLPSSLLPLLNDGGGNLYCLDCSVVHDGENPVVFWRHDHEDGALQEPGFEAISFSTWLTKELDNL